MDFIIKQHAVVSVTLLTSKQGLNLYIILSNVIFKKSTSSLTKFSTEQTTQAWASLLYWNISQQFIWEGPTIPNFPKNAHLSCRIKSKMSKILRQHFSLHIIFEHLLIMNWQFPTKENTFPSSVAVFNIFPHSFLEILPILA